MVKSGLGLFAGRRKSQGNAIEEGDAFAVHHPHDTAPGAESGSGGGGGGGFRVMTSAEADARKREEKRRASEKAASKFRPFSGFGSASNKARNQSFDDDSPASSKRDSKSSSGTGGSRPYNNAQYGSTSTLPSSADTDSNDNVFAVPRPHVSHQHSLPNSLTLAANKKKLPPPPVSESRAYSESPVPASGRMRAMTSSSYASTAKPPTLDADLNFGSSDFDDMFSGLDRKESPPAAISSPGRSLLVGKRGFQAEPIKIDRNHELEVEPPLTSWDSRGSNDNLMAHSPDSDSPPPPPPHKFSHSQQYAPVASYSPDLNGPNGFANSHSYAQHSKVAPNPPRPSPPEHKPSPASGPPIQTPASAQTASNNNTPRATNRQAPSPQPQNEPEDEEEDLFAPPKANHPLPQKPAAHTPQESRQSQQTDGSGHRIMTQAEFRAQQQRAKQQAADSDSESEDYEDEEEAEERAAQEAIARRKKQQMDLARETMRRTTTGSANPNRPGSVAESFSMGFPSEISSKADEWEDEDVPLGILAQHGFPSKDRMPTQPANVIPSYFRNNSTPTLPERPASAGNMGANRASTFRPAFARNLPEDPHATFIGGGVVQPMNRESMGFSRGPASVIGEPMMYPEPQLSAPSLVEQIQMRDMTKQKYMGGASSKKPQGGPFTGAMAAQMNPQANPNPTRISMMNPAAPAMNPMQSMQGMNPMMNMNMMGGPNGMPMMGVNNMGYPMSQQDYMQQMQQFQQMQQMFAAQQMQLQQQMQMFGQQPQDPRMSMMQPQPQDPRMSMMMQPQQDPRMSMAMSQGNNSFLNVPGGSQQRPMSIMSVNPSAQPPPRPYSTGSTMIGGGFPSAPPPQLPPMPAFAPSIAPSERSNIGLSKRYRSVATGNGNTDAHSTVSSSMTLQASGGAPQQTQQGANGPVKGILKKGQQKSKEEEEDEGWAKMAARKNKFLNRNKGKKPEEGDSDLKDIVRGINQL
ncbi:hypothetical protein CC80DRAFT_520452 [Byssothecium circinans]|uniref:Uncharacterized protein n=1 Tax=Byssothecium circinans TaxID=147558 RepID=A0A6A5TD77_9PLEO|nr:hypothetical protein CC80DRAFT_520452 [Byssothecium circinans]